MKSGDRAIHASETVAIIGAGSWGTALSISLAQGGNHVRLWARRPEAALYMREARHNPAYLPDARIPERVLVTSDLAEAVVDAGIWVFATPSHAVREAAGHARPHLAANTVAVSVAKGIEADTLMRTTQVLGDVLGLPSGRVAVLYGPSHAEEVGTGTPTAVVVACTDRDLARRIQETFMTPALRVYVNHDLVGVEIAGSVKNVMAIAAGMSDGVGYGDNAKAALITRGNAEIRRLGIALGADPSTFAGLAGIGDLVVTCMSRHSRNRHLGHQIGLGRPLNEVLAEMKMVAEGVRTTRAVRELARRCGVEMPITEAVYDILFEAKKPEEAVRDLMTRSAKHEDWLEDGAPGVVPCPQAAAASDERRMENADDRD